MDSLEQQCYVINETTAGSNANVTYSNANTADEDLLKTNSKLETQRDRKTKISSLPGYREKDSTLLYRNLDETSSKPNYGIPETIPRLKSGRNTDTSQISTANPQLQESITSSRIRAHYNASSDFQKMALGQTNTIAVQRKVNTQSVKKFSSHIPLCKSEQELLSPASTSTGQKQILTRQSYRPMPNQMFHPDGSYTKPYVSNSKADSASFQNHKTNLGNGITISDIPLMLHMEEETSPTRINFDKMEVALTRLTPKSERPFVKQQHSLDLSTFTLPKTASKTNANTKVSKLNFTMFNRSKSESELKRPRRVSVIRINPNEDTITLTANQNNKNDCNDADRYSNKEQNTQQIVQYKFESIESLKSKLPHADPSLDNISSLTNVSNAIYETKLYIEPYANSNDR